MIRETLLALILALTLLNDVHSYALTKDDQTMVIDKRINDSFVEIVDDSDSFSERARIKVPKTFLERFLPYKKEKQINLACLKNTNSSESKIYNNVRLANHYEYFWNSSFLECQQMCNSDSNCVAITFSTLGCFLYNCNFNYDYGRGWTTYSITEIDLTSIKTPQPPLNLISCDEKKNSSDAKWYNDVRLMGHYKKFQTQTVTSILECKQECDFDSNCIAFGYAPANIKQDYGCFLYNCDLTYYDYGKDWTSYSMISLDLTSTTPSSPSLLSTTPFISTTATLTTYKSSQNKNKNLNLTCLENKDPSDAKFYKDVRMGGHFADKSAASVAECKKICDLDSNCIAVTYAPSKLNWGHKCFLFNCDFHYDYGKDWTSYSMISLDLTSTTPSSISLFRLYNSISFLF